MSGKKLNLVPIKATTDATGSYPSAPNMYPSAFYPSMTINTAPILVLIPLEPNEQP